MKLFKRLNTIILTIIIILSLMMLLYILNNRNDYENYTITTDFGEKIVFKVKQVRNRDGILYSLIVSSENSNGAIVTVSSQNGYSYLKENFISITRSNDINIYSFEESYIFTYKNKIFTFAKEYNFDNFTPSEDPNNADYYIPQVVEILCKTRKLKYIEEFDSNTKINTSIIYSIAEEWYKQGVSKNDLKINSIDGYTYNDLIVWAKNYVLNYDLL